jgi:hypothetical protein
MDISASLLASVSFAPTLICSSAKNQVARLIPKRFPRSRIALRQLFQMAAKTSTGHVLRKAAAAVWTLFIRQLIDFLIRRHRILLLVVQAQKLTTN